MTYVVVLKRVYPSGTEGWITTTCETDGGYEAALEEVWSRPSIGKTEEISEAHICLLNDFMQLKLPS